MGDLISVSDAEIEDLFPQEFIAKLMTRYLQRLLAIQDDDFHEVVESGKPIIPQVEAYAMKNGIALPESWKVDIAKMAKESLLKNSSPIENHSCVDAWKDLFGKYEPLPKPPTASVKI